LTSAAQRLPQRKRNVRHCILSAAIIRNQAPNLVLFSTTRAAHDVNTFRLIGNHHFRIIASPLRSHAMRATSDGTRQLQVRFTSDIVPMSHFAQIVF
jgi:hypothetical protein